MSTNPSDNSTPAGLTAAVVGASFAVMVAVVSFLAGPLIIKVVVVPACVFFVCSLAVCSFRLSNLASVPERSSGSRTTK